MVQEIIYNQSFNVEENSSFDVTAGIEGNALDLTKTALRRNVITEDYVLHNQENDFSILLWVSAKQTDWEAYEITSATVDSGQKKTQLLKLPFFMNTSRRMEDFYSSYSGWSIGVQENGAWYWDLKDGTAHFTYSPTPERQSIRDGNWHLLSRMIFFLTDHPAVITEFFLTKTRNM